MNILDLNYLRRGPYELNTSIELVNFLFFDIETTGLKANRGAKITEIALIDRANTVFHWTVSDTEAHSIDSRTFYDLSNLLRSGVIVGHNINFDLSFIAYEAERMNLDIPQILFCDTLTLAKTIRLKTKN